ncbi:translesion DNA synthesis-associated protein ImuA [Alkalimarinus coralli]|uniref:translesion DNA synthesis-associated protein ImuA n=1 Tax=Alkalimarinus coralli TaxID=2935863 RepID=UPI00202BA352|nr:translesion DNA synthesis-associated protein ImuA [Alkalimarinus coralli]
MSDLIDLLARKQLVWKGHQTQPKQNTQSCGYPILDEKLAGGFPATGVVNIRSPLGIGELRVLMGTLSTQSRLLVFINPPGSICAEFFYHQGYDLKKLLIINSRRKNEALWAAEQCLKSGACGAVLLWQNVQEIHQIKRFQMACEEGDCVQFIMSPPTQNITSLPVSLNMQLTPHTQGLGVSITKRKGGRAIPEFALDMSADWPALCCGKANNVIHFPTARHQKIV